MVDPIGYTLTGASDWPMFMQMFGTLKWLVGGMLGAIITLGVAILVLIRSGFKEWGTKLEKRITSQRKEDAEKCSSCKQDHDSHKDNFRRAIWRELDAAWKKIDELCKKAGVQKVIRLRGENDD